MWREKELVCGVVVVVLGLLWNDSANRRGSLTYNKSDLPLHIDVTHPCSPHLTARAVYADFTTISSLQRDRKQHTPMLARETCSVN